MKRTRKSQMTHFIREDAPRGDITTRAVFGKTPRPASGVFLAKQDCVLSGLDAVDRLIRERFPKVRHRRVKKDGQWVKKNQVIGRLRGPVQDLLLLERVSLNLLQRLSGIATLTAACVAKAKGMGVAILDTRKTTPGLRDLEKKAVCDGGGVGHRRNLSEAFLIKDNHIAGAGSVAAALRRVTAARRQYRRTRDIIVEVKNPRELKEALPFSPDVILLDNMTPTQIRGCVHARNAYTATSPRTRRPLVEVSGGITLKNLHRYLIPGVDRISVGALTHSAPAVDISFIIKPIAG